MRPNTIRQPIIYLAVWLMMPVLCQAQVSEIATTAFSIDINGLSFKVPCYVSKDLTQKDNAVTRFIIVVHGNNRNAADYNLAMLTAAAESQAMHNTLIVAPQFLTQTDINHFKPGDDYLFWYNSGWKIGDLSRDTGTNPRDEKISSFSVLDQLIVHVLSSGNFPEIKDIIVAGFSAGGQFVNRYAASSPVYEQIKQTYGMEIRYMVGAPSSFLYMNNERRVAGSADQFAVPVTNCLEYNDYKYGLNNRNNYLAQTTDSLLIARYEARNILYLAGSQDNNPNASALDKSCPAMLQGGHRLERMLIYFNFLKYFYGSGIEGRQQFQVVSGVGHDHNAIFRSATARAWMWNDPVTSVSDERERPGSRLSLAAYPNPASSTAIRFGYYLSEPGPVSLSIYNLAGKPVQQLVSGIQQPGNHRVACEAQALSAGIYLAVLQTKNNSVTVKVVVR